MHEKLSRNLHNLKSYQYRLKNLNKFRPFFINIINQKIFFYQKKVKLKIQNRANKNRFFKVTNINNLER